MPPIEYKQRANEILQIQQAAIARLAVDAAMATGIAKIAGMKGKGSIITTGMGKAGIIATKMSATLASIGLPSFFVSPAEAGHGDLGRISPADLIIVFSNSGSTIEVLNMITNLHALNNHQNFVINIGGVPAPAIPSDLVINYGTAKESCVVSKVPSTSTTLMLIIADILAITAAESLGFNDAWFKARHPGGAIGASYKTGGK